MEFVIIFLIFACFTLLYFKNSKIKDDNSQELLVQLNDALRKEIQEIRKEVWENAQKSRQ